MSSQQLGLDPRSSAWLEKSGMAPRHSFLEGPCFDAEGNLWLVDAPFGRILRIDRSGCT